MQPVMNWRSFFRPVLFLILSVITAFLMEGTLVWLGFAMAFLFFIMVDIFQIGKNVINNFSMETEYAKHSEGVLGEYIVDSTRSYGCFIRLIDMSIFVDINTDEFIEKRKLHAIFLFKNKNALENDLEKFLHQNGDYQSKKIEYICIHSKEIDQCDVFWDPNGHTGLVGLHFEL